jgi:hypothetical protein
LGRLSGISTAVFLMSYILFGSAWIERIPLAALIGVMFVVSEKTFEWGSLRILHKVPRPDAFIIVAVTVVTVLTDLAIAVIAGASSPRCSSPRWRNSRPCSPRSKTRTRWRSNSAVRGWSIIPRWRPSTPSPNVTSRPASACTCAISARTARKSWKKPKA